MYLRYTGVLCLMATGMSMGQVIPDPGTHAPQVTQTNTGVPVVNVTAPNPAGVSLNHYQHLNVTPTGLIFNNATSAVNTQLGGALPANPQLMGSSASVIVNQVTHPNPSQLLGPMEVAGQKAHLIIANPAGITCDGCGFLNATQGTLTTGTPVLSGNGSLDHFRVAGGTLSIQGKGLDASQIDSTALFAKAVSLSAALKANTLAVVAGNNTVSPDGQKVTVTHSGLPAHGVGIDVAHLGGMYANKITLVATELGAGVHHAGITEAGQGGLSILSEGGLVQSGSLHSQGDISIHTQQSNLTNTGTIYAQQNIETNTRFSRILSQPIKERRPGMGREGVSIWEPIIAEVTQGKVTRLDETRGPTAREAVVLNTGSLSAGGNVSLLVGAGFTNTGFLGAGVDSAGNILQQGSGELTVSSALSHWFWDYASRYPQNCPAGYCQQLRNKLWPTHFGELIGEGTQRTGGKQHWKVAGHVDLSRGSTEAETLEVHTSYLSTREANLAVNGVMTVTNLPEYEGFRPKRELPPIIHTTLDHASLDKTNHPNLVHRHQVGSVRFGWYHEGGSLKAGSLVAKLGHIHVERANITLGADLAVTPGTLTDPGANSWFLPPKLTLKESTVSVGGSAHIDTRQLTLEQSQLVAAKSLNATTQTVNHLNQSTLQAGETLTLQTAQLNNEESTLRAEQKATLESLTWGDTASAFTNRHGLTSAPTLKIAFPNLVNPGGRLYGDRMTLSAKHLLNQPGSPGGFIGAREQLLIAVDDLTNTNGARIYSGGDITLGGAIGPDGKVIGEVSKLRNIGGIFDAQGKLVVNARSIENIEGGALLAGHTVLWPSGSFTNDANVVSGTFSVSTEGSFHNTGRVEATHIDIHANHIHNAGKLLFAHERLNLQGRGPGSILDNQGGVLFSYGDMAIDVGRWLAKDGSLLAGKHAHLNVGSIEGDGRFLAGQDLRITGTSPLNFGPQTLLDAGHTWVSAPALTNAGRVYGDRVTIATPTLTQRGVMASRGRLDLGVGTLTQGAQGVLFSGQAMAMGGSVTPEGQATAEASLIENQGGLIESLGSLSIRTARIRNSNARLETQEVPAGEVTHDFWIVPKDSTERIGRDRLFWANYLAHGTGGYYILRQLPPPPVPYPTLRTWVMAQVAQAQAAELSEHASQQTLLGYASKGETQLSQAQASERLFWRQLPEFGKWTEASPSAPDYALRWRELLTHNPMMGFGFSTTPLTFPTPTFVDQLPLTAAERLAAEAYTEAVRQPVVGETGHWTEFETQSRRIQTQVTHSEPGVIRVGGDMTLYASEQAQNENSLITVGGHLGISGKSWVNTGATAGRWGETTGRMRTSLHKHEGGLGRGNWREESPWIPFNSAPTHETFPLLISRVDQHTPLTQAVYDVPARIREAPQAVALNDTPVQVGQPAPLSNALFRPSGASTGKWFETDPAFMAGEARPGLTVLMGRRGTSLPRRLGDSLYEQWMVRDQVRALTGARFLPGYTTDTSMYEGLLANSLALGGTWPVGQPLSTEVIASLDRSVVWPVIQTVPGPQGTPVEAVVPQVYLHRAPVNRLPAAVSAQTITAQLTERYQDAGTTQTQGRMSVQAPQIEHGGQAQGGRIDYQGDHIRVTGQILATETIDVQAQQSLDMSSQTGSTARPGSTHQGISQTAGLAAGGEVTLKSAGDISLTAAQIIGDRVDLTAAGQMHLGAASNASSLSIEGTDGHWREQTSGTVGSSIQGNTGVKIEANQLTGVAPQITAQNGALHLQGKTGIAFDAGQQGQYLSHHVTQHQKGFMSSSSAYSTATAAQQQGIGTQLTGERVTLLSEAGKIQVAGLSVTAQQDVTVNAQQGITFTPVNAFSETTLDQRTSCDGVGCGSGAVIVGKASSWNTGTQGSTYDVANTLTSATGKVTLTSEQGNIDLTATDIAAATDMTVKGTQITWKPGQETAWQSGHSEASESGLKLGADGTGALGSAQQLVNQLNAAQQSADPTSQRLYRLAGARSGYDMAQALLQGKAGTGGRFSVGYNDQSAVNDFSWKAEGSQTQTVQAGGKITLQATQGDISVKDTTLTAQAMTVETPGKLIIEAGETKSESAFTSHSDQRTVGPGLTAGAGVSGLGLGADVGVSGQRSDGSGRTESMTYQPSAWRVTGKFKGITHDVDLLGSTLTAERLELEIERYLKVISQSNRYHQTQEQTQDSLIAQVPIYGVGGTGSISHQTQSGQTGYEGVGTQAALSAGVDGLSIKAGHTELVGGILQSEATPDKNRLETGTLTASDMAGHYTAKVNSDSVGVTVNTPGSLPAGQTPLSPYAGLALGMSQTTEASQDWKTSSAVGPNVPITISDAAAQAQLTGQTPDETLVGLNRDIPSRASPDITPLDLSVELSAQQNRLGGFSAAGQAVAMTVGDITRYQQQEARKAGDDALAQRWSEGGDLKVLTQAIAAGLLAHVGSADIAGAMAGAAVSQLLAKPTAELGQALAGDQQVIGQLVTNLASSAVGYGAGGQAGSVMASTFDLYNRQLHPDVQRFVTEKERVARYAEQRNLPVDQAQDELVKAAAVLNDATWAKAHGEHVSDAAKDFLRKEGQDKFLADGSGYFTPSTKDFADPSKFVSAALAGKGDTLYHTHLKVPVPDWRQATDSALGGITGTGQFAVDVAKAFVEFPQATDQLLRRFSGFLSEALNDPSGKGLIMIESLKGAPAEVRDWFNKQTDMVKLYKYYGQYDKSGEMVSRAGWEFASIVAGVGALPKVAKLANAVRASEVVAAEAKVAGNVAENLVLPIKNTGDNFKHIVLNHYGPLNPGPLPMTVSRTFRSNTYREIVVQEPIMLYRVYGGTAEEFGGYWTRVPPYGPTQAIIDSALNPKWGNTATKVIKIEIPPGTRIYEGTTAPQNGLVGGGNQILFPKDFQIDPAWKRGTL